MEKQFSLYLKKIGILDEEGALNKIKSLDKLNAQNFMNSSFYYLMNYFDNLTEQQKKFMSFYIPEKYMLNSVENRKNKLKSIIIQIRLRKNLIKLRYLYLWKRNISIFRNSLNNRYLTSIINNTIENEKTNRNKNYFKSRSYKNMNNINLDDNENNNDFNINYDLFKEEYNIENIGNKTDLKPINKLQQISQNTISLDDLFSKTTNNKISQKNKNNQISNIKSIYNYNTINIKPYESKNENKNKINKMKSELKNKQISDIIKYKNFRNQRNNLNKKNNNTQRNNKCNKKHSLLTSLEEKEMEELKECTFNPKINNSYNYKAIRNIFPGGKMISAVLSEKNFQSTFDKLYHDNEKYKLSKDIKTVDHEYMLGKNMSFTPNISNFRKSSKSNKNFDERQLEYLYRRNKNNEELKNKLDYDYQILCSFNPKITEYKKGNKEKSNSVPVFQRLYQDSQKRKNSKEQKEIENINKFKELSNSLSKKRSINYEFLNKLHENNKDNKEDIINKIREKDDKERGKILKPNIEQNDYLKNVSGTFLERNEKRINDKKMFNEEENMKQIENLKKNLCPKKYTKEEKKMIVENIINKLHKE